MRSEVHQRFGHLSRSTAADELSKWLIDEDGHRMVYELNANFSPIEAYQEKQGNWLSFTILLISLASELGIELEYNQVDLPNVWGMENTGEVTLYQHINALTASNPYYHFHQAQIRYQKSDLSGARNPIRLAKKLHNADPRFYALSSCISKRQKRYSAAPRDLKRAYKLSTGDSDRYRYAYKAEMVARLAKSRDAQRSLKKWI